MSDTGFNTLLIGVNALKLAVWALEGENEWGSSQSDYVWEVGIDDYLWIVQYFSD